MKELGPIIGSWAYFISFAAPVAVVLVVGLVAVIVVAVFRRFAGGRKHCSSARRAELG